MTDYKITNINEKHSKTQERAMTSVEAPSGKYMETLRLFPKLKEGGNTIDAQALQEHLMRGGRLTAKDVLLIVTTATKVLRTESNVLNVEMPVNICGDVRGQLRDVAKLFEVGGSVDASSYLFLGNYACGGNSAAVETLTLLYALKIVKRGRVFLVRGREDCRLLSERNGLRAQCLARYGPEVYDAILASFDALPLAAIVNRQFLCVHGGLSPELRTVDDIRRINRFREPPPFGLMCDLLWADPAGDYTPAGRDHYELNTARNCSYAFTYFAACAFLERNKLLSVVRAGQPLEDGFKMLTVREATGFPTVISIYSAPNALGVAHNKGAILHYDKSELNIRQFTESPAPAALPNAENAFDWSLPFVAQKTVDTALGLLSICLAESSSADDDVDEKTRTEVDSGVKEKIRLLEAYRTALDLLRDSVEASPATIASLNAKKDITVDTTFLGAKTAYVSKDKIPSLKDAIEFDAPNAARPLYAVDKKTLEGINAENGHSATSDGEEEEDGSYSSGEEDDEEYEEQEYGEDEDEEGEEEN